ncbi:MAG: hypothetical protein IT159_09620 [Bryobacterales bacterium]|nr:hypothetical protein [Bryobacterales bacterium]
MRSLGIITEVRAGEAPTALLLSLYSFLLLAAYSCIKPVREALILQLPGGAEDKIYMAAATAMAMLIALPLYAKLAVAVPRNRLIVWVTAFFAANLLGFYLAAALRGSTTAVALGFYLWIAVFNMMIVAQFWAFAADIYSEEAGKRLFPLLGLGASLGAVAGSGLAKVLIQSLGAIAPLLAGAAVLLFSGVIAQVVHWREVRSFRTGPPQAAAMPLGGSSSDAFRLVLRERYIGLIALFSLTFTLVKTNGDYLLAKVVSEAARNAAGSGQLAARAVTSHIGAFYAGYYLYVDGLSLALQALVVSRVVKYAGFGAAFFVLPVLAFLDAGTMSVLPLLAVVAAGKVVESATDYSLNNTVRGMLWLPTTRRAKYLAKQTVDTFFVRMGDVVSAVLVFLGAHLLGLGVRPFALCNVVLTLGWMRLAWVILREPARTPAGSE